MFKFCCEKLRKGFLCICYMIIYMLVNRFFPPSHYRNVAVWEKKPCSFSFMRSFITTTDTIMLCGEAAWARIWGDSLFPEPFICVALEGDKRHSLAALSQLLFGSHPLFFSNPHNHISPLVILTFFSLVVSLKIHFFAVY